MRKGTMLSKSFVRLFRQLVRCKIDVQGQLMCFRPERQASAAVGQTPFSVCSAFSAKIPISVSDLNCHKGQATKI